jgi:hypothetical protein
MSASVIRARNKAVSIDATKRVTKVSTNESRGCEHCNFSVSHEDLPGAINHFITEHGYKVLHVGTETVYDMASKPWHTTVAVLGCDTPPALKPVPVVSVHIYDADKAL